jgi:hypothetical protein
LLHRLISPTSVYQRIRAAFALEASCIQYRIQTKPKLRAAGATITTLKKQRKNKQRKKNKNKK